MSEQRIPWRHQVPGMTEFSSISHNQNSYTIACKNVQRSRIPSEWFSLLDHSIVLATEISLRDQDFARFSRDILHPRSEYKFRWTGPSYDCNIKDEKVLLSKRAAVLYNPELVSVKRGSHNRLSNLLPSHIRQFVADILTTPTSNQRWLIISIYLPSSQPITQIEILTEIERVIPIYKRKNSMTNDLGIIFGGDFNMVLDNDLDSMSAGYPTPQRVQLPLRTLIRTNDLKDIYRHTFPNARHGTNRAGAYASRRIDRIYVSPLILHNLVSLGERKEPMLTSTHVTVLTRFICDKECPLKIGTRRFMADTLLYRNKTTMKNFSAPKFKNWDAQIDYIQHTMRNAAHAAQARKRKGLEPIDKELLKVRNFHKHINHHIKGMSFPAPVFTTLETEQESGQPTGEFVHTTAEILESAYTFWRMRMQKPKSSDPQLIRTYLQQWPKVITPEEAEKLDKPFTIDELETELTICKEGTPGEDGIPYSFWRHTWEAHGPQLTQVANALMEGQIPRHMSDVLITLLPKKKQSTNIRDFRPISLTNTSLRIICRAINSRLLATADNLIGKYQTGFIPQRRIHQNIAQFKELVRIWRESPEGGWSNSWRKGSPFLHVFNPDSCSISMIDFEKAFDSISHEYIETMLIHTGIPNGLRTAIMTILTNQYASIYINRTKSKRFPLSRGTMQGNPFSPFIFILCIEPLLYLLNTHIRGFQLEHTLGIRQQIKVSAFADDLTIFMGGTHDCHLVQLILQEFCRASNSSVNKKKSLVITRNDEEGNHPILKFPTKPYRNVDIKYLGFPLQKLDWMAEIEKLMGILNSSNIRGLGLTHRAHAINTFLFSKLYYRDLHSPMDNTAILELKKQVTQLFPYVSEEKIFARIEHGGFGVIDIKLQLEGLRAGVVYKVLTEKDDWYFIFFRANLQLASLLVHTNTVQKKYFSKGRAQETYMWWGYLMNLNDYNPWKHPRSYNTPTTARALREIPKLNLDYLKPYTQILLSLLGEDTFDCTSIYDWHTYVRPYGAIQVKNVTQIAELVTEPWEKQPSTRLRQIGFGPSLFKSRSKQTKVTHPVYVTSNNIKQIAGQRSWVSFWLKLKKRAFSSTHPLDYLHLFHIGNDFATLAPSVACPLCATPWPSSTTPVNDKAKHMYFECSISHVIWEQCQLPEIPTPAILIGNPDSNLDKLDKFCYFIRILLKNRRPPKGNSAAPSSSLPGLTPDSTRRNVSFFKPYYQKRY